MNQFMIGLVLVIIIIILVALLGALNKMYPENFLGTCQDSTLGTCPKFVNGKMVKGKNCDPTGLGCLGPRCVKWNKNRKKCLRYETTSCSDCGWNAKCKCA